MLGRGQPSPRGSVLGVRNCRGQASLAWIALLLALSHPLISSI